MIDLLHIVRTNLSTPLTGVCFAIGIALAFMAYRSAHLRSFLGRASAVAFGSLGLLFIAASNVGLPVVANNTMLGLLPSTQYLSIARLGFAAPGDAPVLWYTATNSPCSLNSGAGDGGSQIPSADGKCFIAQFAGLPDIREWGAKPDGTPTAGADNTAAFNAAALYSSQTGRAILVPAVGAFAIGSAAVTIYTNTVFTGESSGDLSSAGVVTGSLIMGLNGTSAALFQTQNFSSLTGTNTAGGPYKFGFRHIAINGNKANRSGSADCADIYGYDYVLDDVEISYCPGKGLYSEWAVPAAVPVNPGSNVAMEAQISHFKTLSNGGDGLDWFGPHDSVLRDVITCCNGGYGLNIANTATYVGGSAFIGFHSYGNQQDGVYVNGAQVLASHFQSESNRNTSDGIHMVGGAQLIGSLINIYSNGGNGIETQGTSSFSIDTVVSNGNSGNGIFVNAAGGQMGNITASENGGTGILVTRGAVSAINVTAGVNRASGIVLSAAQENFTNVNVTGNAIDGIEFTTNEISATGIIATGNTVAGVVLSGTLSDVVAEGRAEGNGTQVVLGRRVGPNARIDFITYNNANQTSYSGSYATGAWVVLENAGPGALSSVFSHP